MCFYLKLHLSSSDMIDFIILIEVIDVSQSEMRISQILACYGWRWQPTSISVELQPHQSTFHLDNWQLNLHCLENTNPWSSGEVNQRCLCITLWLDNVTIVQNWIWLILGFSSLLTWLMSGLCFDWKFPNIATAVIFPSDCWDGKYDDQPNDHFYIHTRPS